jgi:predicted nucleic acid-binding protein
MTLVLDAAPIVGLADPEEPQRATILSTLRKEPGTLVVPAPISAEADYLLGQRLGDAARHAFLRDLTEGRFVSACLERDDYATVRELDDRYSDLELGLADCSLVVLAERYDTVRVMSFDERHLRALEPLQGGAFVILPADDQPGVGE